MNKYFKFLILFLCMSPLGLYLMYLDYMAAENFEADGEVVEAIWNTKNHQMPLFKISTKQSVKQFQYSRITLTPDQVKVGDRFSKVSGSKVCTINNVPLQCVE